jgi:gliding motility-associated-like protein
MVSFISAQDLTGLWQGVSYIDVVNPRYYIFTMNLKQTGTNVSGIAEVREVGTPYYGIQRVSGTVSNNNFSFKDIEVLDKNLPSRDTGLCWREGTLVFEPTLERISGLLSSTCAPIKADLYRLTIRIDSILCNPQNVTIQATGQNLRWYKDSLKQNLIDTGKVITTYIDKTTTLFVTQTIFNTESPSIPVTIQVKNNSKSQNIKICQGQNLSVGDTMYKTSGIYTRKFKNLNGCDSIITTNLTVNPVYKIQNAFNLCSGEMIVVGDTLYKTSGIYNKILKTTEGCDSTITTNVTVSSLKIFSQTLQICEGNKVSVGDTIYQTTGQYFKRLRSISGCDSLISTNLTVKLSQNINQTLQICEDEKVVVGDTTYRTSGIYVKKLKTTEGCDSTITINLSVSSVKKTTQSFKICEGEAISVGDTTYKTTGKYLKKLRSSTGCDSVVITDLTVFASPKKTQSISICEGESIIVGDTIYKTSGTYIKKMKTINGCDSIITTQLVVNSIKKTNQDLRICNGKSVTVGDTIYKTNGTYFKKLKTHMGCDSLITTKVSVINEITYSQKLQICDGASVVVGDTTYKTSGIYIRKIRSTEGCDSIVTTDLNVIKLYLTVSPDTLINLGDSALISATATFNKTIPITWKWSPSNSSIKCDTCATTWVKPTVSTQYQIEVRDKESKCYKTGHILVKTKSDCALFVPTAFSPNGDNVNDILSLYPSNCIKIIKRIAIFNRWGNLILEKHNIIIFQNQEVEIWNGLIDGKPSAMDTYIYFIEAEYTNGKNEIIGGDFTIIK